MRRLLIPLMFLLSATRAFGGYTPFGDIHWKFPVASTSALPTTNNSVGDARVEMTGFTAYVWTGSAWVNIATGGSAPVSNPMTTLGDMIYGGAAGAMTRLAGNTTTTMQVLTQTGNGSVSAAPAWTNATASSTASSIMKRDSNSNSFANNFVASVLTTSSSVPLTVATPRRVILTGSSQTITLPDATTLTLNTQFEFNNNGSNTATINDNSSAQVCTIPAGGYAVVFVTNIGSAAGTWDKHFWIPANSSWGTSGLSATGSVTASTQLISSVATGTAPLQVSSTTQVANLNAATAGSATSATNATNVAITDDTSTNATMYPVWVTTASSNQAAKVSSTLLNWNPTIGLAITSPSDGADMLRLNAHSGSFKEWDFFINSADVLQLDNPHTSLQAQSWDSGGHDGFGNATPDTSYKVSIWAQANEGALKLQNNATGTGDLIRTVDSAGTTPLFIVSHDGSVTAAGASGFRATGNGSQSIFGDPTDDPGSAVTTLTIKGSTHAYNNSNGLSVLAGSSSNDYNSIFTNAANNDNLMIIFGNGQIGVETTNWGTGGTAIGVSSGKLTTSPSSIRYKENIKDLSSEIDTSKIYDLKPVVFDYKKTLGGKHSFGLIAEQVEMSNPWLVNMEKDAYGQERPESVSYDHLSVLLLEEVKKLRGEVNALKQELSKRDGNGGDCDGEPIDSAFAVRGSRRNWADHF